MRTLINPSGRFVVFDNDNEYDQWLNTSGFRKPSAVEEKEFIEERTRRIEAINNPPPEPEDNKVYMATVTQGAKDGYSISSGRLINELKELGIYAQTHWDNQKISLLFHNPYSLTRLESPYKILYTMFESDKIPDDWSSYLEIADEILVPSKWCQEVFQKAGFATKVLPLGYDDKIFKFHQRENKGKSRQDFVFLHYNAFNIRKGFVEVFKAFVKAFDQSEPVKMIFKTVVDPLPLPIRKDQYPNIEIIQGKMNETDLAELCNKSDCFVFPSRGEGFGIPPLEAMATGMPAIVPNAHGITEYFNPEFMYEAKVAYKCPALYTRYKNQDVGKMVVCDVDQLAAQMRYIYEHQEEALEKGKKASEYVKKWTFSNTAIGMKAILDEAFKKELEEDPLKNKLVLELI